MVLLKVEDSIEYLLDQLVAYRERQTLIHGIANITDLIDENKWKDGETLLHKISQELAADYSGVSAVVDLQDDPLTRFDEYEDRRRTDGSLMGITTGFPTIDKATNGLQPGQLVTCVATPKAGKTQLMVIMATTANRAGHVPFIQSYEMSRREIENRHDAYRAGINHNRLRNGTLLNKEERKYIDMLEQQEDDGVPFFVSDAVGGLTLSAVQAQLIKAEPDVAFIDGVYLMHDEVSGEQNTPQALTNISRGFKQMAQRLEIPIVISTQALKWKMKGQKLSADAIGYSSSFFQDSDVILGLQRDEEETPETDTIRELRVLAARNSGPAQVELTWDWDNSIFAEDTYYSAAA